MGQSNEVRICCGATPAPVPPVGGAADGCVAWRAGRR